MFSVELCTTGDTELPPLTLGAGFDWETLTNVLRREVNAKAAFLLAEPVRDPIRGVTHWYVETDTDPQPLSALAPDARRECLNLLQLRRQEILAFADQRQSTGGEVGRTLAEALRLVIGVPDDSVFVWSVDGNPVLCAWGRVIGQRRQVTHLIVAAGQTPTVVHPPAPPPPPPPITPPPITLSEAPKPRDAASDTISGGAGEPPPPSRPVDIRPADSPVPPKARRSFGWLWVVFAVLCVAILLLLIPACALRIPGIGALTNQCLATSISLGDLRRYNDELRARLHADEMRVAALGPDCPAKAPPQPVPNPALSPVPGSPPTEQDTRERRREAKAAHGKLDITLSWNGKEDLDLHVLCPEGQIYYGARTVCGGTLQVDANSNAQTAVMTPIEHVTWADEPPHGTYTVQVVFYHRRGQSERSIPFSVTITDENGDKNYTGVANEVSQTITVTTLQR